MLWLTIAFPLFGFALLGLFGRRIREPAAGILASALVLGSFLVVAYLYLQGGAQVWISDWLPGINFSLILDPLAAYMCLIVTGIGFLIHVYSIGYMKGDPGFARFFSYLNFFIAMMLILVLAGNYAVMFIGWEGVGLASFLLIGFWYQDLKNTDSARKAFIVNRIGDFGFLLGMALIYGLYGTLEIPELRAQVGAAEVLPAALGIGAMLLFVGAIGKSAQVPLMVWLPDAMAGPTPVSALIHAATMVTAGVYLVARSSFIFSLFPWVSYTVAIIGLITALYGALSAFGQNDIKRVVAYSTISQLGYMFLAVGVGAYWIALFHVLTHAFFKALLFMTSGSVIHALGGEQDLRQMGGLRKLMPQTHIQALIGVLALGGFPLLSGFWSKDQIITATLIYPFGGEIFYAVAIFTALLTAIYAMRWYVLVFLGQYRGKAHPHEAPGVMTVPNWILALGAVFAGFLAPEPWANFLDGFFGPVLVSLEVAHLELSAELLLIGVSIVVALLGLGLGYWFFSRPQLPAWYQRFAAASAQAFYADAIYQSWFVIPAKAWSVALAAVDRGVDFFYRGLAGAVAGLGRGLAWFQSGYARGYATWMFLGLFVLLLVGVWGFN